MREVLNHEVDDTTRLHHCNELIARHIRGVIDVEYDTVIGLVLKAQRTTRRECCRERKRASNTLLSGESSNVGLTSLRLEVELTHTIVQRVDSADLSTCLGLDDTLDIDMTTINAHSAEGNQLLHTCDEVTTLRHKLHREVILEGRQLHLTVELTTIGVNVHTDAVGHILAWAECESEEAVRVGLGHMACSTSIDAERVLDHIVGHRGIEAVGHLNRSHHLARTVELVGHLRMYCIVDVVTNLDLLREEQRLIEVGLPLRVCTQGVLTRSDSRRDRHSVVEATLLTNQSHTRHHRSRSIDQLHIDKLGVGRAVEVDGVDEEGTEVDGVARTIEGLIGHQVKLLLHTSRSVVVNEAACHNIRKLGL